MSNDTNVQPENVQEPQNEAQQEQPQDEPKDVLGDAGKKALDAERKRANEAEKRFKEAAARIEEFENAQRTEEEKREHELQTLRAQIEEERKQREAVERDLLIKSVATEFGLPDELANRLVGDDRETLVEDAKQLQKLVTPSGPRKPAPVPEAGSGSSPLETFGELQEPASGTGAGLRGPDGATSFCNCFASSTKASRSSPTRRLANSSGKPNSVATDLIRRSRSTASRCLRSSSI